MTTILSSFKTVVSSVRERTDGEGLAGDCTKGKTKIYEETVFVAKI